MSGEFARSLGKGYKYILAIRNGEDASAPKNEYQEKLLKLEEMLANYKTKFFGGNSVSMIDYLIWPWFERIEAFQLLEYRRYVKELNACEQIQNFFLEECCKRRRQENSKNIGNRFIYNHWHICIISKSKD